MNNDPSTAQCQKPIPRFLQIRLHETRPSTFCELLTTGKSEQTKITLITIPHPRLP